MEPNFVFAMVDFLLASINYWAYVKVKQWFNLVIAIFLTILGLWNLTALF